MMSPRTVLILGLSLVALSACGGVRESLGLGRNSPDEFAVVDRPPLALPPDYTLRPPRPGAERPQDVNMTQRANETLFGTEAKTETSETGESGVEQALLKATGADRADPNIREIVNREASEKVVASEHLLQRLLWWKEDEKPGTVVDAPAEAQRLQDIKEKGEPINKGATPIIERQKSGWLGL